jgi:nuclear pore complex protein Nup133
MDLHQSSVANFESLFECPSIGYQNPLHFSFPPDVDEESLMRAAEQLSQAILRSGWRIVLRDVTPLTSSLTDSSLVRNSHDLIMQLQGRKDRLGWLIHFINDNGALEKV